MNVTVIIPTYLTYDKIAAMVDEVRRNTPANIPIHATCCKASASENRNRGLAMCGIGDIAIMIDDDMRGFYPGWVEALIEPLLSSNVSMVSARLITVEKQIAPCQGDTGDTTTPFFPADQQKVPSAAIAFFNDGTIFDEGYAGAGWEDTDFCRKIVQRYPEKHIVINNRCKLIHMNESKHEGANTANKQYFDAKWKYDLAIDTLIFSKDRPMQLDLLLQSMRDYFRVSNNGINVLYKSSNAEYGKGYAAIARKYRNVNMIPERSFQADTTAIVDSFSEKHCMFFADDEIFINEPDIVALMAAFTDDVASVSLRLGKSVNYCQPARKAMDLPQFISDGTILKWNWTQGDLFVDWNYPRSLIGTIHRTETIKAVLHRPDAKYRNPNEMECAFHPISADTSRPNMVSMPFSCIVSIPANIVSNLTNTPHMGLDPLLMAQQYNAGWRIWPGELYGMRGNTTCFPEMPYVIHRPRIGVFFERTGRVNGCQKVALNTIAGLDKLGIPYSENRIETYNGALHMVHNVRQLPANTVIGPESMVLPEEHLDMWRLYQNWTTPCEWVTRSYRMSPCAQNARITEWPAGIDTERFTDTDRNPEYDAVIFYKNVTKQTPPEALESVKIELDARGLKYSVLQYGHYREDDLIAATKQARFAVWLVGTESQNIALLEVLACGVPVYVIDETTFKYSSFTMPGATSAPYFDGRCGIKALGVDQLDRFIDTVDAFQPREYVLDNFTLERCAQAYYDMLITAKEY